MIASGCIAAVRTQARPGIRISPFVLLPGQAVLPDQPAVGVLLLAASGLNLWRLARWRGTAAWTEPLLAVLHLGYAWMVAGTALLGLSLLTVEVPMSGAVHALTLGAAAP